MKDLLLSSFSDFEISNAEKAQIKAGKLNVTGCSQNGSTSFIDIVDPGGVPHCGLQLNESDAVGWVSDCGGRLAAS